MAPTNVTLLKGEKRPLYVAETASLGTLTCTGATFSLWSNAGTNVINNVAATSYTTGPDTQVQAYYTLDSASLALGGYYGTLTMQVMGSDNIVRTIVADFRIYVRPVPL